MKRNATQSTIAGAGKDSVVQRGRHAERGTYQPVFDSRKRRVRGLWKRNDRFYAQLRVADMKTGKKFAKRFPLGDDESPVTTVPQAIESMNKLKSARSDEKLKVVRSGKKFFAFTEEYLSACKLTKRPATYVKEKSDLKDWKAHFGDIALKQITKKQVLRFREKLLAEGYSPRTANLKVITLRNLLNRALDEEIITELPVARVKAIKTDAKKRPYFPPAEIEHLAACAVGAGKKSGGQLADFIRLLLYSGCRRNEALRLRWEDVDFDLRQLSVGADGDTKNHKPREVDFNPQLEEHLRDMFARRQPDSQWLFPSVQRGEKDVEAKTFKETLTLAKVAAAERFKRLSGAGFHDCRHTFISVCVMAGLDFMTIAKWVGHKDGGILIGKVYGHLAAEHRQAMAAKLNFQPVVLEQAS